MYYHLLIKTMPIDKCINKFYLIHWKLLFFNKFHFLLNFNHWQATIKSFILINEPQVPLICTSNMFYLWNQLSGEPNLNLLGLFYIFLST